MQVSCRGAVGPRPIMQSFTPQSVEESASYNISPLLTGRIALYFKWPLFPQVDGTILALQLKTIAFRDAF